MEKTSNEMLGAIKAHLRQSGGFGMKPVERIRQELTESAANFPALPDVAIMPVSVGGLAGEWVDGGAGSAGDCRRVILYFHGGGFIAGSCASYRDLAARISKVSGVKVLTVEYRLAPEHLYPAANEDCLAAYRWLRQVGYAPEDIVVGGDSVGASLALMTLLTLRDHGEPLPAGAFLLSPHTDLVHLDGESYLSREATDPTGSLNGNRRLLELYLGGVDIEKPPILSPLRMDLRGLPRILIQVGDEEVLLSDAERFADRSSAVGVEVKLEIWERMWSVFQLLAYLLPEAEQAIANIGAFVRGGWPSGK